MGEVFTTRSSIVIRVMVIGPDPRIACRSMAMLAASNASNGGTSGSTSASSSLTAAVRWSSSDRITLSLVGK